MGHKLVLVEADWERRGNKMMMIQRLATWGRVGWQW